VSEIDSGSVKGLSVMRYILGGSNAS
jgi:hypothetical protein